MGTRAWIMMVMGAALILSSGCDHVSSPSTTQCEVAIQGVVPEATLKSPTKMDCEASLDRVFKTALKKPDEGGLLGKIKSGANALAGEFMAGAAKFTDNYKGIVQACEKEWTMATVQCVEAQMKKASEDKVLRNEAEKTNQMKAAIGCFVVTEAQAKTYTDARLACETDWSVAMVDCLREASNVADRRACTAWPWSDTDPLIEALTEEYTATDAILRAQMDYTEAEGRKLMRKYLGEAYKKK